MSLQCQTKLPSNTMFLSLMVTNSRCIREKRKYVTNRVWHWLDYNFLLSAVCRIFWVWACFQSILCNSTEHCFPSFMYLFALIASVPWHRVFLSSSVPHVVHSSWFRSLTPIFTRDIRNQVFWESLTIAHKGSFLEWFLEKCCQNLGRVLGMKVVNQLNAILCLKKKGGGKKRTIEMGYV